MDNTLTLQQSENNAPTTTGNPQDLGSSSLQTTGSGFQNPASQTSNSLAILDGSSSSIPLAAAGPATTTATVATTPVTPSHMARDIMLYGGLALVVIIFMISLSYGLMRQK